MMYMHEDVPYQENWESVPMGMEFPRFHPGDTVVSNYIFKGPSEITWCVVGVKVYVSPEGDRTWRYHLLRPCLKSQTITESAGLEDDLLLVHGPSMWGNIHHMIGSNTSIIWPGYRIYHPNKPMCVGVWLTGIEWEVWFVDLRETKDSPPSSSYTIPYPLKGQNDDE